MSHTHQRAEWLESITRFERHPAWRSVTPAGRRLVRHFRDGLRRGSADARANVVSPFTAAVRGMLRELGVAVDLKPASVPFPCGLRRTCDVSFPLRGRRWVIEIKTGLEFNSLGAAVLEAKAFRARDPGAAVVLLALYGKRRKGDLLGVLRACRLGRAFDQVHVLTANADHGDGWYENWAANLNTFVAAFSALIPGDPRAG